MVTVQSCRRNSLSPGAVSKRQGRVQTDVAAASRPPQWRRKGGKPWGLPVGPWPTADVTILRIGTRHRCRRYMGNAIAPNICNACVRPGDIMGVRHCCNGCHSLYQVGYRSNAQRIQRFYPRKEASKRADAVCTCSFVIMGRSRSGEICSLSVEQRQGKGMVSRHKTGPLNLSITQI